MFKTLLCLSLLLIHPPPQPVPDAATRSAQLSQQAKEAYARKDHKAYLATLLSIVRLQNDSAPSVEQLAAAYGEMGDRTRTLQALKDFVAMGQADDDLLTAPQVSSLKSDPEFKQLMKRMELNKTPVQHAIAVADFHDPNLVPEDIDFDSHSKTFLVTSVLEKKIVRISMDGSQQDFARAPDGWPMLALKVDANRGVVWATEAAMDKFAPAPFKDWGRSAVLCFRLKDGSLARRVEGPVHSALGDMALTPDGDVIASDGAGGGVYRVRADGHKSGSMERLDEGDFISPQTPAVLPDGRHLLVPDYVRGVGVLNLVSKQVGWIETHRQHTLNGIDGLYLDRATLIAVQNGTSPERVAVFRLDKDSRSITAEEIIERSTPTLGDPTHGVVMGKEFFHIANSGWDSLDDHGMLKPHARMTPAHLMKATVLEH